MERILITPREHWKSEVESLGFSFHSLKNEIYWDESCCYRFDLSEIKIIENATNEIETMCLALIDNIITHQRYHELNIPEYAWPVIETSWKNWDKTKIGRLDLGYNGIDPPKLLEYNGDTPVCLLEGSLVQKQWLDQVWPNCQQFNSIQARLVENWPSNNISQIHVAGRTEYSEILDNMNYLAKTMELKGIKTKLVHIDQIGWNGVNLVDDKREVINNLYKYFPWEWMSEEFYNRALQTRINIMEPAWKMMLSNKGMMVLLWEMFPEHPNLLPSYFDYKKLQGEFVKKPLSGRGGVKITIHNSDNVNAVFDESDHRIYMYQQILKPANFENNFPVIGSWIINGQASGIGMREDITPISNWDSRFVPHFYD